MNILFTCGGTAGHINPAIALARLFQLHHPGCNILFAGAYNGMERDLVPKEGYQLRTVYVNTIHRAFRWKDIKHNLITVVTMPRSRRQAAEIIREVDRLCAALAAGETGPYLAEYRRRCVNLGRTVRLLRPDGGGETAEALDIDEEFGLVVRRPDGAVKTVRSGEVSVRGLLGYV